MFPQTQTLRKMEAQPFEYYGPVSGQTTHTSSSLSPKRDHGSEKGNLWVYLRYRSNYVATQNGINDIGYIVSQCPQGTPLCQ